MMSKKIILTSIALIIILAIAIGGYVFINQQAKKELGQLTKESRTASSLKDFVSQTKPVQEIKEALPKQRVISLPSQPKAEKKSSFSLKTDKSNYLVGESFNLTVLVNAQGEVVDGVEFILNYDPKKVEIGQPILGSFFSLYPQKQVDSQKGEVRVIALQKPTENKSLNQAVVVTLPITTLQKGKANFSFVRDKTHIAAYGGQDLLKEAVNLSITIE